MSVDARIKTALKDVVSVIKPNVYKPLPNETPATEYCVFNYTELPTLHGDNSPHAIRYLVQVHWFLPTGTNPNAKKKQIKNALMNAGFTYPSVINASDGEGQHFVFEMEYCDGDV